MKFRFRFSSAVHRYFRAWIIIAVIMAPGTPLTTEAQQALPKIDAEQLKKISGESAEIETLIIRATPQSIADAARALKLPHISLCRTRQALEQLRAVSALFCMARKIPASKFLRQRRGRARNTLPIWLVLSMCLQGRTRRFL